MSQSALKPKLAKLGLRQSDLARLIDVSPRTVNLWASGSQPLPGAVAGYLRLLEAAAPQVRQSEFDRLDDRSKHLEEGIYGVSYCSPAVGEHGFGVALLVKGKITGGDANGMLFSGSYRFDRIKAVNVVQLTMGLLPGDDGLAGSGGLQTVFTTGRAQPVASAKAEIGSDAYELELRFLAPLPQ